VELGEEYGLAGGADEQGEFETKPYLVSYFDRGNFINQLAGTTVVSGGAGGRIIQNLPYQLPDNPRLYYRSCSWKPEGALIPNTSPIQYTHSVVTALFRQPQFNYQGSDDPGNENSLSQDPTEAAALFSATQELDFTKEWLTIPNASVKFKSDGALVKSPKGRGVTVVLMQITWDNFPYMPMGLFRNYADSVNNATFLGAAKGTVFFEGPKTHRTATVDGVATQRIQMNFKWRAQDWNKQLRDDGITWDYVVDKSYTTGSSDTFCNYAYQDFSQLLLWTQADPLS
jgi:hypothetical protein